MFNVGGAIARDRSHADAIEKALAQRGKSIKAIPIVAKVETPFTSPVGRWQVGGSGEIKGCKLDPPKKLPNGKELGYMRFKVPIRWIEVGADHWKAGTYLKILASASGISVEYPSGDKDRYTPSTIRPWLVKRFGAEIAKTVLHVIQVGV